MSGEEYDGSPGTEQPTHSEKGNPPESTGSAAIPFKRLGNFELLREFGRGGMGVVYEAQQISLKRCVALKVLPPGLGLTDQAVQRFEREAQTLAHGSARPSTDELMTRRCYVLVQRIPSE